MRASSSGSCHRLVGFAVAAALVACESGGGEEEDWGDDVTGPSITPPTFRREPRIEPNPNPAVPMAAIVEVVADTEVVVDLSFVAGDHVVEVTSADLGTEHQIPVVGFRPGRRYAGSVTIRTLEEGGAAATSPTILSFDSPPLPDYLPSLTVLASDPVRMEPGVTLFAPVTLPQGSGEPIVLALDEAGEVVWYFHGAEAGPPRSTGRTLVMQGEHGITEIDLLGNVRGQWYASGLGAAGPEGAVPVPVNVFHHELEVAGESFLSLDVELRNFPDYPTSESDPLAPTAAADVVGDVLVEFDRDGAIVTQIPLFDVLDPYRIGYDSLYGFWDATFPAAQNGTHDWGHANAAAVDPIDGNFLISLRHQDAVIKVRASDGGLLWILGPHDNWSPEFQPFLLTPEGELEWPYHPHAPALTSDGGLLLFDNGTYRACPVDPKVAASDNYRRAVEYTIDEAAMSVRQTWVYGPDDEVFYAPFLGAARPMPTTGNVLVTDGGRSVDALGEATDAIFIAWHFARIVEVTRDEPAVKVFEVRVGDELGAPPGGVVVYRAERAPGLVY